ncbi:MAG: DNA topoisomerase IV [Bacteroidetes bacterium GWF2_33_16]|nr:MAG: DNA topoisomerase IV [Bacteroidetes bacterium GWE2_32_14]OFY05211.1 MAG: DNA topoisomerase IV [Bacteroidetes bacterium GWF2_33_16]
MSTEQMDNIELPENEDTNQQIEENNTGNGELHKIVHLSGMYKDWFLDYASYVILERAVPHLNDGLKPVQRRILHAMKRLDDGRYNKVANIIGFTMQFHPHGDASIGDALVQLGQKDLLIDAQGNWGNVLTGDSAAAPRYIEARLSKFAADVVFNPKTTEWKKSYDGRNDEPVTLPIKFPLLLAQGVEGIAVGLASKILPHNFNELIDASIAHLKGKSFELYPDFPTGGIADFSRYNDGIRGGSIKVRARIEKEDKKTLKITEVPFGKTTQSLIDSILKVAERGKIKIRKIDDNTAEHVEILIHLVPGISPDQTIDALYAFTDCEVPISPNSCVIDNKKPIFIGVTEMLKISTDNTVKLLNKELEIKKAELQESWHMSSLEKIFIEKKIYRDIEESETWEAVISAIDKGLKPYTKLLLRKVTVEDIEKLTEIKIKRISKFDVKKADEIISGLEDQIKEVQSHLDTIIEYAINYFKQIRKKHGDGRERKTEIRNLETIAATQVVVANEKLYVNREEGFIGYGLKKDEYVCECSDIDEVITFLGDGRYIISKVAEKNFVGKNIIHVAVFKRNDNRTIYNIVYRDGLNGAIMIKRCAITGITRDKEYDITKGTKGSKILYMSVNPNGEAEVIKVFLRPRPRLKKPVFEFNFTDLAIKGKQSMGNVLTKYAIHKIVLKEEGFSTLGGRKIWFEEEVLRLNADGRGKFLGEFHADDKILIITKSGKYRLSSYDLMNHFEDDIFIIEKFRSEKIFSAVYYDADLEFYYLKRFTLDPTDKLTSFIGDNEESRLLKMSEVEYPRLEVSFGGRHKNRESEIIEVADFIGVKSYKAKGKRLSNYEVKVVTELEPLIRIDKIEPSEPSDDKGPIEDDPSQMSLFDLDSK